MLNIPFIEYIVLAILSAIGGWCSYRLVTALAKSVVEGNRSKFFINLILTSILVGLIYTICHSIFAVIQVGKIKEEYNLKASEYKNINVSTWNDERNAFTKNQLLYSFYHKNDEGKVCKDLSLGVLPATKEAMDKVENFNETPFAKASVELCNLTEKYVNIEANESCATKDSGILCSWMNPLLNQLNYKFRLASVDAPLVLKEVDENSKNILDEDEAASKRNKTAEKDELTKSDEKTQLPAVDLNEVFENTDK